ncbi:hypothetical protein, conserved [Plasmodium gonderi]|uniref:Uncharacterized protein n=1 Tax=Plasmodium gonderi TaxID=77519 RepID=A0A1Y1JJN4_PLAGO|nr:hypothetical protein, conserved [Plasmodium gonderi]GAW81417.1 hypothetical protein, conserved [Plasmodium gonderi]
MEGENFFLKEKIQYDEFNKNIQEEYKKRFDVNNKIEEYFDDVPVTAPVKSSTSLYTSTSVSEKEKNNRNEKKTFLHNFMFPFIELGNKFYSSVTLIYEPKLYHLSIFMTILWAYKNIKCINKLLIHKYNDIHYQITRPDSLNSRYKAFKVLAIGGSVIPCSFIAFTIYNAYKGKTNSLHMSNYQKIITVRDTTSSLIPYTLRRDISRKLQLLKEKTLFFGKDLAENNNFKKLSKEYHRNVDKRLQRHFLKKGDPLG